MKRLIAFAFFISIGTLTFAQPAGRAIVNQSAQWFATTANLKVAKRLTILLDGQYRFIEGEPQQYQSRVGLDVKINDHLSIIPIAYVYTWNYLYGKQPASYANNEHRFWQQAFYKHTVGRLKLDHRVRYERRFIQQHSKMSSGEVIYDGYQQRQNRARYRFMARYPLNKPSIDPKALFASVYDEVFISWGGPVTFHKPDQNRIFAGLGYQFTKEFNLQGGFIYQELIKSNGAKQENNVGFQMLLGYNVDLTKKTK